MKKREIEEREREREREKAGREQRWLCGGIVVEGVRKEIKRSETVNNQGDIMNRRLREAKSE